MVNPALFQVGGAIAGGLGGLFGGRSARKAQKRGHEHAKRQLKTTQQLFGNTFGKSEQSLLDALAAVEAGHDDARRESARIGSAAKQRVVDREQVLGSQISQSMQSRGLGNTTADLGARRGLASSTNRDLLEIDSNLAGIRTGLATQRGRDLGAAHGALSRFQRDKFRAGRQVAQDIIGYRSGMRHVAPDYSQGIGDLFSGLENLFGDAPGSTSAYTNPGKKFSFPGKG